MIHATKSLLAALAVVVLIAPGFAEAKQPWARRAQVGVTLGFLSLDEVNGLGNAHFPDDIPKGGLLMGLRVSYPLIETVSLDAEYAMTSTELPRAPVQEATLHNYRLLARYTLMPGQALRPFVTAGYGQMRLSTGKTAKELKAAKKYVEPVDTDDALLVGVGAQYQLGFRLFARLDARWIVSSARPDEFERDAAGKPLEDQPKIEHGAAQNFEVSIGLSYAFGGPDQDTDGDGVPDDKDKCPKRPEDRDGFQDTDGCPEIDNDADGVPDNADRCPNAKEDKDGFKDNDGCPDLDNDGDGVPDAKDKCPNKAEDKDGFKDSDGCPDLDNDRDGVPDAKDRCPNKAEDRDRYQDTDGCPDPDNDGDGIPDAKDKCPNKAEDKNNFKDDDGCPENMPAHIAPMFSGPVKGLKFRRAKLNKSANKVLESLLELLLEREDLKIEVHVHTHTRGRAKKLKKLSEKRAKAIVAFYVDAGIDANRFVIVPHGGEEPVAKGRGRKAKKANERVLFKIATAPPRPGR
ncbi:MAG: thrombospondin type 3 repeat-containing protein [Myxococcales bacterium]|nr:thrombospondin type 3 repeat-containing protein [Myxococcales bacterium]